MMAAIRMPGLGEPLPPFRLPATAPSIDVAGGRAALFMFFESAADPATAEAITLLERHRAAFDDIGASFYGVTGDPGDAPAGRVAQHLPGMRYLVDAERVVARGFGMTEPGAPSLLVVDRLWRVAGVLPLAAIEEAVAMVKALSYPPTHPEFAPVAQFLRVFEPDFCAELIDRYHANGGGWPAGVMLDQPAGTRRVLDQDSKVRRDYIIDDPRLGREIVGRLERRLLPLVTRCFQYRPRRIERLLVGCYDAADGGHFRAHRDDVTQATAHRRFAVTINLNTADYDGGDLCFPEFGARTYRVPTGGAIVFSCSLLHQVMPVTRGRRFAFLPFLIDVPT